MQSYNAAKRSIKALLDTIETNPQLVPGGDAINFVRKVLGTEPGQRAKAELGKVGGGILNLLSRGNYAMARLTHEFAVARTPVEAVWFGVGGFAEELLSGVGVPGTELKIRGEKITFGQALEELGVPAGPRLSETPVIRHLYRDVGEAGWRPTRGGLLDGNLRDAGGVLADIFSDPVTYVSAGAKPIAMVKEAGKPLAALTQLTRQGTRVLGRSFEETLPEAMRYAAKLRGVAVESVDDIARLQAQDIKLWREIEMFGRQVAQDAAHRQVYDAIQAGDTYLRVDPGIRFAGRAVVSEERLRRAGEAIAGTAGSGREAVFKGLQTAAVTGAKLTRAKQLEESLERRPVGVRIMSTVDDVDAVVQNLFYETLRLAGKVPGYKESKVKYRADMARAKFNLKKKLDEITKGWDAAGALPQPVRLGTREVRNVFEYVTLHLDDPARFPVDPLPAAVRDQLPEIRRMWDEFFEIEVKRGFMDPEVHRHHYAPHYFGNKADELRDLSTNYRNSGRARGRAVWALGPHGEARVFNTWTDAVEFHAQLRREGSVGWDLDPVLDIREVFLRRGDAHYRAIAGDDFMRRVKVLWGVSEKQVNSEVFERTFPELKRLATEAGDQLGETAGWAKVLGDDGLEQVVGSLLRRADAGEPVRLAGFDPEVKALYIMGRLRTAEDLETIESLLRMGDDVWADLDMGVVNQMRELIGTHRRQLVNSWNEPWGPVRLKKTSHAELTRGLRGVKRGADDVVEEITETFWLPQSIADDVTRLPVEARQDTKFVAMLKRFDLMQDIFKVGVTAVWPAFHFRNHYSNVAQNFVDIGVQAIDPRKALKLRAVLRGGEGTINTPFGKYTFQQVRDLAMEYGLIRADDIQFERLTTPWRRQVIVDAKPLKKARAFGTGLENHAKMVNFVTWLERGASPEQAAARAHKFIFDYEAITPAQRQIFKRLFPFHIWTFKNLQLTTTTLPRELGHYSVFAKLRDRDRGPDADALPDYQRGRFKIRLDRPPNGRLTYVLGIDLPLDAALERMDLQNGIRMMINDLTPVLKLIGEIGTETDWFMGRDLHERQMLSRWAAGIEALPAPIQRWMGYRRDTDPETGEARYSINGTASALLFKSWAFSRVFYTLNRLLREDMTIQRAAFDLLFGVRFEEFDQTELERRRFENNRRRLEQNLIRMGAMRSFDVPYQPKSTKPKKEAPVGLFDEPGAESNPDAAAAASALFGG